MPDLDRYRRSIDANLAELRLARRMANEEKRALESARQKVEDILAAQKLVQEVAATIQASAHAQISKVVTRCLRAVFGEESYEFVIRFDQKRSKTEARLLFKREGQEIDPVDAAGGGVLDIASLALRLACLMLAQPKRRKLLCLDEPAKHLSANFRPAVKKLILALAKEPGIQFILVSHAPELQMGTIIELD